MNRIILLYRSVVVRDNTGQDEVHLVSRSSGSIDHPVHELNCGDNI